MKFIVFDNVEGLGYTLRYLKIGDVLINLEHRGYVKYRFCCLLDDFQLINNKDSRSLNQNWSIFGDFNG